MEYPIQLEGIEMEDGSYTINEVKESKITYSLYIEYFTRFKI